ncbi:MAG: DUF192 domain-containing protein [Bacillota bacterium]
MPLIVKNSDTGILLAVNASLADTFMARLKGLSLRKGFGDIDGMLLSPCSGIHTFNMRFSLDVIYLSENNRVVHIG